MASAELAAVQPVREDLDGAYKAYNLDLKARVRSRSLAAHARLRRCQEARCRIVAHLRASPRISAALRRRA
jgi:hypothetical protein